MNRRSERSEEGVTAILVAIVLTVIFAMAAFVLDSSALYVERRALQNGADAAALAVARKCAAGSCGAAAAQAQTQANGNGGNGGSNVDALAVNTLARQVSVTTSTRNADGSNEVHFTFAPVIGLSGKTVHATAVAAWGPPATLSAVPLTLSLCDFNVGTQNGVNIVTGPPWPAVPQAILFHQGTGHGGATGCNGPAGQQLPGGFGWLDGTAGCKVTVSLNGIATEDPGNSPSKHCQPADMLNKTILLPVFDGASGQGNNGTFHVYGFTAFHVVGFHFPTPGWDAGASCGPSATCLLGWFTRFVLASHPPIGGPDLGVTTVKLIG